jgi:hypothetical protein
MALRIRRGTSVQRTGITPVSGELIFDTTQNKLYVGNGSTAGGVEVVAGQIGGNLGSNINLNNFDIIGTGNINITGTITASGTITGNGDLVLGNADTDNVQFGADINSNIVPNTGSLTVGTSAKPWQTVFTGALENTSGITSNSDLTLNGLVTVGNNLVPSTTLTRNVGTSTLRWRNVWAETLSLENIQITQNNIQALDSNSDIKIIPSGTGAVVVDGPGKIKGTADFGTQTKVTRAQSDAVFYDFDTTSGSFSALTNASTFTYTQLASTTAETFTFGSLDTSQTSGFKITMHVYNSVGAETFVVSGAIFGGAVNLSTEDVSSIAGSALVGSLSTSAGAGSLVNLQMTTTTNIPSGTITKLKVFSIFYSN